MSLPTLLLISLADPLATLRSHYRDYVMRTMQHYTGYGQPPFVSMYYEGIEFMIAMLSEIFSSAGNTVFPDEFGQVPKSTRVLMAAGLDKDAATQIASEVFRSTIAAMSAYLPNAAFGDDRITAEFCGDCDVMVSIPKPMDRVNFAGSYIPMEYDSL